MDVAYQRIGFLMMFAALFAALFYIFFSQVLAVSRDTSQEVTIRDAFRPSTGSHMLTGHITVPSDCYDISARTHALDEKRFAVVIDSWQQPYRTCSATPVSRDFSLVVSAPQYATFMARLDGSFLSTVTIRDTIR